jgi:penicillin-binding protein 1C
MATSPGDADHCCVTMVLKLVHHRTSPGAEVPVLRGRWFRRHPQPLGWSGPRRQTPHWCPTGPGSAVWRPALGLALASLCSGLAWMVLEIAIQTSPVPSIDVPVSRLLLDRDDRPLRAFTVDEGRWRLPVTLGQVDPGLVDMLLDYEDRRFHRHSGVDWRALLRAGGQLLRHGRVVSGGSTITMQLVRLRARESTRTPAGKLKQMLGALALERVADKRAILGAYLQLAPYGGNLEGVRAASLAWLGKEPSRLTPAERALLVALPQAPEARRPDRDPVAARRARDRVLERAERAGVLGADEAAAARREPVPTRRRRFPMLAAHSARHWRQLEPERIVYRTTLDAGLQQRLEALAAEHAATLPGACSVAILVAEHAAGLIRAAVGSAGLLDRSRYGFVDMTRAVRSPGSALKPLIYGLAFEQGLAHPEGLIEDRPTAFRSYVPGNFDREFQGTVSVRQALQRSLNVPAVTLLERVGPVRLLARMRRAGADPVLPDERPAGLAIGLGGVGLRLRGLVAIYAAIARGGEPVALTERRDRPPGPVSRGPVLSRVAAWYLSDILSGISGPAARDGRAIALKTGTSWGYRDAWAIGFDGRHVVGVWAGRPNGAAVSGLSGAGSAVPILIDAFARIGPVEPLPGPPPGTLLAQTSELPVPLRRVRATTERGAEHPDAVTIAFPPQGARLDLGLAAGTGAEVVLKVHNGRPPFTWLANGRLIAREPYRREARWQPDGRGFATIAVIDARGDVSRVSVLLQ